MRCVISFCAILGALLLFLPYGTFGHTIPNDVTVQTFVKTSGEHLNVLVRVPFNAVLDNQAFPLRRSGALDLLRVDSDLHEAADGDIARNIELYEGDTRLPNPQVVEYRLSLFSDRSFVSYEEALAHVTGPKLSSDTDIDPNQLLFDVLLEYPIQSDQSSFSIRPGFHRLGLRVVTVLRFLPPNGAVRAFEFVDDPGLVRLDPRWYQAALRFVWSGFFHILAGTDHLLFLLCLVIPFRRFRALIPIVTSFTVAHSITLIASAYNWAPDSLWFPPLIETLIAISIVFMALENIVGTASMQRRRWIITFGFGLVHGFGFSFALRQTLQFAGDHLLTSLLSFNAGVELGQLLVLLVLIPALDLLFKFVTEERMGTIILSALVAHTGWHWMVTRAEQLIQYQFQWPALITPFLLSVMRWLMLAAILGALAWVVRGVVRHRLEKRLG